MTKKRILKILYKNLIIFSGVLAFELILYFSLGINCLTKLFGDFNCPFCGMTRAHVALLSLDFKSAFSYHPLFFLGIPYLVLLVNEDLFCGKWKKPYWATVYILTALFILRFILSIIIR